MMSRQRSLAEEGSFSVRDVSKNVCADSHTFLSQRGHDPAIDPEFSMSDMPLCGSTV